MQGVGVLKEGVVWRVGNGQNINIWSDPWLPRNFTRRPITPRGRNLITKVDELIHPLTEQWDSSLLEQIFWEDDAQLIKSIPIHPDMEDIIGWHYDPKGIFSVKSAYKVHRDSVIRGQSRNMASGAGDSSGNSDFWKKLWNLDCPLKLKHFLWRLSHNTLAVRRVLHRRGMKIDTNPVRFAEKTSRNTIPADLL